jgi:hypothetical protein
MELVFLLLTIITLKMQVLKCSGTFFFAVASLHLCFGPCSTSVRCSHTISTYVYCLAVQLLLAYRICGKRLRSLIPVFQVAVSLMKGSEGYSQTSFDDQVALL